MGCDIHAVVQTKHQFYPKGWQTVLVDSIDRRSYILFGLLAGVRTAGVGILPKGFPSDFTIVYEDHIYEKVEFSDTLEKEDIKTYHKFWMGDHSHSYHTLTDLESIYKMAKNKGLYKGDLYLLRCVKRLLQSIYYLKQIESKDDIRIVFGFDS